MFYCDVVRMFCASSRFRTDVLCFIKMSYGCLVFGAYRYFYFSAMKFSIKVHFLVIITTMFFSGGST